MGWFGTDPLDGDDGMDVISIVFDMIGIEYDDNCRYVQSDEEISNLLNDNQDKIYKWLADYNWSERLNPKFTQEIYVQAVAQIMLDYNVKIPDRIKIIMIDFAKNDGWAEVDEERKESMNKLIESLKNN